MPRKMLCLDMIRYFNLLFDFTFLILQSTNSDASVARFSDLRYLVSFVFFIFR